ncbi:MAG: hypothetical protein RL095_2174 [Verrucomicrobiota bacterium]|jgi:hypothetical protein
MISIKVHGGEEIRQHLLLLVQSEEDLRRLHYALGNAVVSATRKHLKSQVTVDGQAMAPRKRFAANPKRLTGKAALKNARMLRRMAASSSPFGNIIKVIPSPEGGLVTWPNDMTAQIAYRHQFGVAGRWDNRSPEGQRELKRWIELQAQQEKRQAHSTGRIRAPATHEQATDLVRLGFFQKVGSGGQIRRDYTWIRSRMSSAQAEMILRKMGKTPAKDAKPQAWDIPLPARPFLGVSKAEMGELRKIIIEKFTRKRR